MKIITNAIAELAGVIVDTVKNEPEPHEVQHGDDPSDLEFPTQEEQEQQNAALHELDTFVDELEREVRDGAK